MESSVPVLPSVQALFFIQDVPTFKQELPSKDLMLQELKCHDVYLPENAITAVLIKKFITKEIIPVHRKSIIPFNSKMVSAKDLQNPKNNASHEIMKFNLNLLNTACRDTLNLAMIDIKKIAKQAIDLVKDSVSKKKREIDKIYDDLVELYQNEGSTYFIKVGKKRQRDSFRKAQLERDALLYFLKHDPEKVSQLREITSPQIKYELNELQIVNNFVILKVDFFKVFCSSPHQCLNTVLEMHQKIVSLPQLEYFLASIKHQIHVGYVTYQLKMDPIEWNTPLQNQQIYSRSSTQLYGLEFKNIVSIMGINVSNSSNAQPFQIQESSVLYNPESLILNQIESIGQENTIHQNFQDFCNLICPEINNLRLQFLDQAVRQFGDISSDAQGNSINEMQQLNHFEQNNNQSQNLNANTVSNSNAQIHSNHIWLSMNDLSLGTTMNAHKISQFQRFRNVALPQFMSLFQEMFSTQTLQFNPQNNDSSDFYCYEAMQVKDILRVLYSNNRLIVIVEGMLQQFQRDYDFTLYHTCVETLKNVEENNRMLFKNLNWMSNNFENNKNVFSTYLESIQGDQTSSNLQLLSKDIIDASIKFSGNLQVLNRKVQTAFLIKFQQVIMKMNDFADVIRYSDYLPYQTAKVCCFCNSKVSFNTYYNQSTVCDHVAHFYCNFNFQKIKDQKCPSCQYPTQFVDWCRVSAGFHNQIGQIGFQQNVQNEQDDIQQTSEIQIRGARDSYAFNQ
eukprot:403338282